MMETKIDTFFSQFKYLDCKTTLEMRKTASTFQLSDQLLYKKSWLRKLNNNLLREYVQENKDLRNIRSHSFRVNVITSFLKLRIPIQEVAKTVHHSAIVIHIKIK